MNGFQHYIPTPNKDRIDGTGRLCFNVLLAVEHAFGGKVREDYMSRTTFSSHPTHVAFIGGGWADVYART